VASIHVEEPIDEIEQKDAQAPVSVEPTQDLHPTDTQALQQKPAHSSFLSNPKKRIYIIVAIVVLLFIGYAVKTNNDKQRLEEQVASLQRPDEDTSAEDEATQLKEEIGQFLELPQDEEPTVVTVVDAERVRNQSFFKSSQNGDKVLLYATSGKAILYRPSTKKIIEVAPINLGQSEQSAATEQPETP
jgi:hypothetical protein